MTINEIKTRFKKCIDQYYHYPNTQYIKDHQLDYIGGVLQAALHILPTDDYFDVKQYVFEQHGYDPGGCQTRQIELKDYIFGEVGETE